MNDVSRIAFVTAHFEELQGLMPAAYGAGLLFAALAQHFLALSTAFPLDPMQVLMPANFAVAATMAFAQRYQATFGRVVAPGFTASRIARGLVGAPQIAVAAGMLFDLIGRMQSQRPSFAPYDASKERWPCSRKASTDRRPYRAAAS